MEITSHQEGSHRCYPQHLIWIFYERKSDVYVEHKYVTVSKSRQSIVDLNMCLLAHHIYFIRLPQVKRSNVLTHLVAPRRGQATRDGRLLNMYSECKSRA